MSETRTVFDPFDLKAVEISNRLVDRLRGKYASGPHLPNGKPEFGWRQFEAPPIQHEAAAEITRLQSELSTIRSRTIEECAKVAIAYAEKIGFLSCEDISKSIRALDTGGKE